MRIGRETRITWMMAALLGVVLLMLCLSSCKTREMVTEAISVHDTLYIYKSDTVRDVRTIVLKDTTHYLTERIVTIKEDGDTMRIVSNNTIIKYIEKTDSAASSHHKVDSCKESAKEVAREVKKTVKSNPVWWERIAFILIILFLCVVVLKSTKI